MQTKEKILDDLARLAGGTAGFINDTGKQIKESLRSRADDMAQRLDLVPREDFERLELMVMKCREEQEKMLARIEELENAASKDKKK